MKTTSPTSKAVEAELETQTNSPFNAEWLRVPTAIGEAGTSGFVVSTVHTSNGLTPSIELMEKDILLSSD
jgi:hypothetical protein